MGAPFCQHIHIACFDVKTMADFWVKGFGAKLDRFRKFGEREGATLDINTGQTKLNLVEIKGERQDKAASPRSGVEHICMMVPDLDKYLADLTAMPDVTIAREPFMSGDMRCAFINGPDGIYIELAQEST